MRYYNVFSPEAMKLLKELNDEILKEEKKDNPDNQKILKLKNQILMKGIEMSSGFRF